MTHLIFLEEKNLNSLVDKKQRFIEKSLFFKSTKHFDHCVDTSQSSYSNQIGKCLNHW